MSADPSSVLLEGGRFTIPAGVEGYALIRSLAFEVPRRSEGRTSAHRERFCFTALLKALLSGEAAFLPASIVRGESPDFLIQCGDGRTIAVEHSDTGEREYQRHLAESEDEQAVAYVPSPSGDGWLGDMPEKAFAKALRETFTRKLPATVWRNAPESAERWLLTYDQTNTRLFLDDASALELLRSAASHDGRCQGFFSRIDLVRSQEVVLTWRRHGSGR